eukprot:CAMPEP_0168168346 /NCGR_PEP_ID=MMETSP0139_2-20121125/3039_1 /TAXON_ID=44445 /ORGANISM="Pseudo-nitzschia australis, Strain 10249 10 AB" /LENGTH=405 /DNA_ID=CAMNT_0008085659 /DNA_START=97 /DNA_END=1311 /DNA_ORIENTATION=+
MLNLVATKIFIAVGTFLISFTSCAAPLKVIRIDDHLFSIGNTLAAGVLFAGGLVHQLPSSSESLRGALGDDNDYPLAPFIAGLTFALFLILEEYLHIRLKGSNNHQSPFEKETTDTISSNRKKKGGAAVLFVVHSERAERPHERSSLVAHDKSRNECIFASESDCAACKQPMCSSSSRLSDTTSSSNNGDIVQQNERKGKSRSSSNHQHTVVPRNSVLDSMRDYSFSYEHPVHYHEEHLADHAQGSLLSSVLLLVALSFHSLFETLAIGVTTNTATLTSTTSAILAHKAFAGYALGSAMVASQMRQLHVLVLSFVFSVCSIVGVFVGIALERVIDPEDSIPIGVIQAMVSGTFLYVSIVEIGMKELMTHREGGDRPNAVPMETWQVRKLVAFLIGYLIMAAFAIW